HPRFQGENFKHNLDMVSELKEMAKSKGCTAAQLALAWVLRQGDDIVPIPGTKRRKYLEQNVEAAGIQLSPEELEHLDEIAPPGVAYGDRYHKQGMATINR
ncbi:MAG: aldo/keto reductase, partial [Chloroflexota bacterium]